MPAHHGSVTSHIAKEGAPTSNAGVLRVHEAGAIHFLMLQIA